MERHGDLNESLQEFLFGLRRGTPDVFQSFVRVKKSGPIEELNSFATLLKIHALLWHTPANQPCRLIRNFIG